MDKELMTDKEFHSLVDDAAEAKRAMIVMFRDKDGNWRGGLMKDGSNIMLKARQTGPEICLQLLLTHDGRPETKTE